MLVHQTGRMPSKGLIVTNLDACELSLNSFTGTLANMTAMFPNIKLGNGKTMLFDRILADVPYVGSHHQIHIKLMACRCSGDGTLRKNSEIWNKWGPTDGNSLHT